MSEYTDPAALDPTEDPTVEVPSAGAAPRVAQARQLPSVSQLDLRRTFPIAVGAVLVPLGIAFILLGWHGAAYGKVTQVQIPYLISGGLLGLAVVMIGCFFYFSHWLYRLYDQADLNHREAMRQQSESMRELIEVLRQSPGMANAHPEAPGGATAHVQLNGTAVNFLATPTGTNFHVPGCPMIANKSGSLRSLGVEEVAQMRPCRVCDPLQN